MSKRHKHHELKWKKQGAMTYKLYRLLNHDQPIIVLVVPESKIIFHYLLVAIKLLHLYLGKWENDKELLSQYGWCFWQVWGRKSHFIIQKLNFFYKLSLRINDKLVVWLFSILFLLDLCKEEHFKDSSTCTFAGRQGNNNNFHISLCLQPVKGDDPVVIVCPHTRSSSGGYSHSII